MKVKTEPSLYMDKMINHYYDVHAKGKTFTLHFLSQVESELTQSKLSNKTSSEKTSIVIKNQTVMMKEKQFAMLRHGVMVAFKLYCFSTKVRIN